MAYIYVQSNNIQRPSPQTFNVDNKYHELGLRNVVLSRSLPSQSLRHTNFELGGSGGWHTQLKPFHIKIIVLRTFVRQQSSHTSFASSRYVFV